MKIIPSENKSQSKLPLKLIISFESVFEYLEKIVQDKNHLLYHSAKVLLEDYKQHNVLREGFEDRNLLFTYEKEIDKLLDLLFPDLLQSNEIKAASIPFDFTIFKFSSRFKEILENSGEGFELELRNYEESRLYILSCTFILAYCYGVNFDFKRPFFYDIPDASTGMMKHYRALFNGDFFNVKPLESAPEITEADIDILRDNFDNIDVWMEKFPPNSYEFKGFGIMNLFDVTSDQALADVGQNLLRRDVESFKELEQSISRVFNSKTVKFGFSVYSISKDRIASKYFNEQHSFLNQSETENCKDFFCGGVVEYLFDKKEVIAISDMEKYAENTKFNDFSRVLLDNNIKSVILVPIELDENQFGVMELVSEHKHELNSVNAYKLKDIIPVFEIATQRFMEEYQNKLESLIQENYTSIHPTVKWKFYEEAEARFFKERNGEASPNLKNIVFEQVMPLYGQSDIRNSSVIRNKSIQEDLVRQLSQASRIMELANERYTLPIYGELSSRLKVNLKRVEKKLHSGDEKGLIEFLQKEIYPVFNHLKSMNKELKKEIDTYMDEIDDDLQVLYDKRKKYENSVTVLNEKLAAYIDEKQIEAQNMFPHFFERYKTDGIEYNMYIGASLVNNETYHEIYLQNLRLWQLQMMCELENVAVELKDELEHPLEIASLILAHNAPLSIEFRVDEKRFDVDGAYNIRYEIIKKRIDKAKIQGSTERLTQPGKIAIVYSQKKDAQEYLKYIKHLQAKDLLLDEVEDVDLEELQGISGLKALRVSVNYKSTDKNISLEEIMKVIKE